MRTGIVAKLVWSHNRFKIYENPKTGQHCLYDRNEEVFNAPSFDEVYAFSIRYRNMKV